MTRGDERALLIGLDPREDDAALGGKPLMWNTGHSLIKSKMKETGAPLAGEMSGHVFFAHQYFGYDDALYAAIRLIAASARLDKSVTQLRGEMPALVNTPEMRFQVDESRKFAVVDEVKARLSAAGADVNASMVGIHADETLVPTSDTKPISDVRFGPPAGAGEVGEEDRHHGAGDEQGHSRLGSRSNDQRGC